MIENSRKVLITGVSGFLGRYTAQYFSDQGWSVIGVDSVPPENAPLSALSAYYSIKLPDKAFNELLLKHSPSVCIHSAGRASVPMSVSDPVSDYYANTVLTFEVLDALRLYAPTCRFILLSSAAVYGNPRALPISEAESASPISPYGFHKLQCEQLCIEYSTVYGLKTASVRIFSAYGPGLRRQVLWDICRKVILDKSLTLQGSGNESRDFIHARDVACALSLIVNKSPMEGNIYNLSNGIEVTIRELAAMVLDALDSDCLPCFDGIVPVGNPLNWQADISKLNELGFTPSVPLQHGVKAFANWCRAELVGI